MTFILNHPLVVLVLTLTVLYLAEYTGIIFQNKRGGLKREEQDDFGLIVAAALTLLGLIIGFSFSMSISRYDQRKDYEEAEANAIGTEYLRADLLPAANASKVRLLLAQYLDQRILFYNTRESREIYRIDVVSARLASDLWSSVQVPAMLNATALSALAASGMNDVLNSQGYTEAAWLNRIPAAAWILMTAIAVCCSLLLGYGLRPPKAANILTFVLPLVVSISFFLIADIDTPVGGVIRVSPINLISLAQSLHTH
jgi:hypothetical protein